MSYSLYQDGSVISTTTGTSGTAKTVNVTAPSAGSHTYKYVATDGNGTTTTSGNLSITTYAYTPPAFSSVSAVRWSTGTSSGVASDEGTYCKATANFSQGKVGTTAITTTCTIKVDTYTGTATNGTAIWLGGGNLSADNTYQVTFTLSDGYGNSVVTTDTLTQGGRGIDLIYGNGHYGVAIGQKATADQVDINMQTLIRTGSLFVTNGNAYIGTDGDTSAQRVSLVRAGAGTMGMYSDPTTNGGRAVYFASHGTGAFINAVQCDTNNNVTFRGKTMYTIGHTNPIINTDSSGNVTFWGENFRFSQGSGGSASYFTVGYNNNSATGVVSRSSGLSVASSTRVQWGRFVQLTLVLNAGTTAYSAGSDIFEGSITALKPQADVMGCGYYLGGSYVGWLQSNGTITIRATGQLNFSNGTATISWTYLFV